MMDSNWIDREFGTEKPTLPEFYHLIGEVLTEMAAPDEPVEDYCKERIERIIELANEFVAHENGGKGHIQMRLGDKRFRMGFVITVDDKP